MKVSFSVAYKTCIRPSKGADAKPTGKGMRTNAMKRDCLACCTRNEVDSLKWVRVAVWKISTWNQASFSNRRLNLRRSDEHRIWKLGELVVFVCKSNYFCSYHCDKLGHAKKNGLLKWGIYNRWISSNEPKMLCLQWCICYFEPPGFVVR